MQRIADVDRETSDPIEFLEALKLDLEQDEVYVFTPKGRVIALPARSTPVDFAYAIHTEVGHRCIGARVNGRLVPLDTRLTSADTVEIFTSKSPTAGPSRDWLQIVASSGPATRSASGSAASGGRTPSRTGARSWPGPCGARACRSRRSLASSALLQVAAVDEPGRPRRPLRGHRREPGVGPSRSSSAWPASCGAASPSSCRPRAAGVRGPRPGRDSTAGVYVEGLDDVMVHLARCCTPVPGDQIVGFVTQGRGVSVHRADCSNAAALPASAPRSGSSRSSGTAAATASSWPPWRCWPSTGPACSADVSRVVSEHHLNIVAARTATTRTGSAGCASTWSWPTPPISLSLLASLKHLDGVFDAYRQLPGKKA